MGQQESKGAICFFADGGMGFNLPENEINEYNLWTNNIVEKNYL